MNPAPGTGPFKFKSFVPNETIEFTRNDQYYEFDEKTGDRLPYLDSVLVKKIVEETVRWTALRAGDMDIISAPPLKVTADAVLKEPVPGMLRSQLVWPHSLANCSGKTPRPGAAEGKHT